MPIDSSIYAQLQAPDLMGSYQRGLQMKDLAMERSDKMKLRQTQDAQKLAAKNNLITNPDGSMSMNKQGFVSELAKTDGMEAYNQQRKFEVENRDEARAKLETARAQNELRGQLLGSISDQPSYERAVQEAIKVGLAKPGEMPPQYDPKFIYGIKQQALSLKDRIDQQWKEKEFGLKEQEIGIKRNESKAKAGKDAVDLASNLRKERSGLPTTRDTADISAAYNKIQAAAKNPSPAGDMSLIFGYMKILDPGSTVREGEFANAQNAGGVDSKVAGLYNRIANGERLTPAQRQDFISQAGNLYKSQMSVQKQVDSRFGALAKKSGIDERDVLLNFEANDPAALDNLADDDLDKLYKQAGGQ